MQKVHKKLFYASFKVGTGTLQDASLGFKEDGTKDLRSSTEELHFMDKNEEKSEIKSVWKHSIVLKSS